MAGAAPRWIALVASGSPSCSSRRQDSGIRRGVVGARKPAWRCGFFFLVVVVRGGLLRCFGLAIGDNGLMRAVKLKDCVLGRRAADKESHEILKKSRHLGVPAVLHQSLPALA